jgi:diaminopimelate decarboxylase
MSFEPGRYLVAEAGTLLVTVTDIKRNPSKTFVGVDSGMGHLIRPAMYGSYHHIENLTHPDNKKEIVAIAGYYCESGDLIVRDREIPMPIIGDVLAIKNAGAYGYVMSSHYNLRERPAEILIDGSAARLIRARV